MLCGKCGTQMNEGALFCPNCGEKATIAGAGIQARPRANVKKIALLTGVVIGLVIIVSLIVLFAGGGDSTSSGGSGYQKTLNNYYKAFENNDADLMYSSVVARYWIDYMNEGWGNSAYELVQDSIEERIDEWNCGEDIKITYKIRDRQRATEEEELSDLEEYIYERYAYYVYDKDEFSITDAYILDIEFTIRGNEGTRDMEYSDGLLIIKENGEWRIPRGAISCSFYDNQ